jgi:uncharacterized protein
VVQQVSVPKLPVAGYADLERFKIYVLDTGLLGAMLNLTSEIMTEPTALFSEYNGAFVENYVCHELIKTLRTDIFYWTSSRKAEVDFLFQHKQTVIPIEVKSGLGKSTQSIRIYAEKFKPEFIIRTSPRNFVQSDDFVNLPLYGLLGIIGLLENKRK